MLGGDAHPVPADGGGHGLDGLVLADDVVFQAFLQLAEALELLLPDAGGGNLGPAVLLSERYITDRFLPDKAIDLIDEASSDLNLKDPDISRRMQIQRESACGIR